LSGAANAAHGGITPGRSEEYSLKNLRKVARPGCDLDRVLMVDDEQPGPVRLVQRKHCSACECRCQRSSF
jgi:hypothetical protein